MHSTSRKPLRQFSVSLLFVFAACAGDSADTDPESEPTTQATEGAEVQPADVEAPGMGPSTDGVDTTLPQVLPAGYPEQWPEGSRCERVTLPVSLETDGSGPTYPVVGALCWQGELSGKTTQVLLHGAGYGPYYWDFPLQPEVYSYLRPAVAAGYAVFNLSRLGAGASGYPPSSALNMKVDAVVVHHAIEGLRSTAESWGSPLGAIITVGHSMGSIISMAHGIDYPADVDGIILTGFLHNVNADYLNSSVADQFFAQDDARFALRGVDDGYLSSRPESRRSFYWEATADEAVIDFDFETRETLTLDEILSIREYYRGGAELIDVPVLQVVGDDDFIGCGTNIQETVTVDCSDPEAVAAHERSRFAEDACLETRVMPAAGHVLNLQTNAPDAYAVMLDWLDRRIGSDMGTPGSSPCE